MGLSFSSKFVSTMWANHLETFHPIHGSYIPRNARDGPRTLGCLHCLTDRDVKTAGFLDDGGMQRNPFSSEAPFHMAASLSFKFTTDVKQGGTFVETKGQGSKQSTLGLSLEGGVLSYPSFHR